VKVVAIDALPAMLPYVDQGIAPVLLAQPTYNWGYVSVEKIIDQIYLKKEVPVLNKMELVRVTKADLSEWARQLVDWGFTDVPKEYLAKEK
jgi:ribose transport system substrate-binding protein